MCLDVHECVFVFGRKLELQRFDLEICRALPSCWSPTRVASAIACLRDPSYAAQQCVAWHTYMLRSGPPCCSRSAYRVCLPYRYAPYTGRRTTFRMLNKKHALKLLSLGRSADSPRRPRYRPQQGEAFLLWHYSSVLQAPQLARQFPDNRLYFLSSNLINWQVTHGFWEPITGGTATTSFWAGRMHA